MMAHPILINRPIVVTPIGVRLCRPSERVLDLLPIQEREFVKEDGERVIDTRARGGGLMQPSPGRRLFAEWLGTAFLLAAVVGSGIMAEKLAGGNIALALLCNTIPTGAILVVLILIFGPLSGAHFNPAVTIAFAWRGELPWRIAAAYVACPNRRRHFGRVGPLI